MQVNSVTIGHFRALRNCVVQLADSSVLVGQNGAGKSTVLQALRFFFEGSTVSSPFDACHGVTSPLLVRVTFSELSASELDAYAEFLDGSKCLTVTKTGIAGEPAQYLAMGRKYPGFDSVRMFIGDGLSPFLKAYRQFAEEHPEYDLGKVRSADDAKAELRKWEAANEAQLVEAEVEFAFQGSTKTQLIPTTRVVYVPAVHNAAEDFKVGRSPLGQMVDAFVLTKLNKDSGIETMKARWDQEYQELFSTAGTEELQTLSTTLSKAIADYVPGAAVKLGWREAHPDLQPPSVWSSISEDGISTTIEQQGHGLQRAMIMAMLQARDEQLRAEAEPGTKTDILLLIEEPELYQHPPRARHFRRLLQRLATDRSGDARFRVVSSTHSADFVSLDDLESIRIVRKEPASDGAPNRKITSVTIDEVAALLTASDNNKKYDASDIRKNLHVLDAPLREAFFSSGIVLTEGVGDVGALFATSERLGIDLEAKDIVVTTMDGKGLMHVAIATLSLLGIRTYVVFDADKPEQAWENQRILRLIGADPKEIASAGSPPTMVRERFTILQGEMEDVLREEFKKEPYGEWVAKAAAIFGKKPEAVMKNPAAARFVVDSLYEQGLKSKTLEDIVGRLNSF